MGLLDHPSSISILNKIVMIIFLVKSNNLYYWGNLNFQVAFESGVTLNNVAVVLNFN